MDYTKLESGFDLSHYQGEVDWWMVKDANPAFVIIKATERMGVDPQFENNRQGAEDAGILWLPYPFLRSNDSLDTVRNFIDVVGDSKIPVALDWESSDVGIDTVKTWLSCTAGPALVYWGLNPPDSDTEILAKYPRWFPEYPRNGRPRLPMWNGTSNPDWRTQWFIWQYSDRGRVSGVPNLTDMDRLACKRETFVKWYKTGILDAEQTADPIVVNLNNIRDTLSLNSSGYDVLAVQRFLNGHGFPLVTNGEFGQPTKRAVMEFQKMSGLDIDGVVGPMTLAEIIRRNV